jgi:hypothetical protein
MALGQQRAIFVGSMNSRHEMARLAAGPSFFISSQ